MAKQNNVLISVILNIIGWVSWPFKSAVAIKSTVNLYLIKRARLTLHYFKMFSTLLLLSCIYLSLNAEKCGLHLIFCCESNSHMITNNQYNKAQ